MALLRESPNVKLEGLALFLLATLQVPRVVVLHILAIEIVGEDLLEIFPTINQVSQ
jgi:hypothetical protein